MRFTRRGILGSAIAAAITPLISKISPASSPSPERMAQIAAEARKYKARWLEMPADGDIRPGQLLALCDDGFMRPYQSGRPNAYGFALAEPLNGLVPVAIDGMI